MPRCVLDHLVITAPTLEAGAAFVRDSLGVAMQKGGEHPRMGTHNLLLRLGDATFLEVLAPDPGAHPPGRPRWFGLDALRPDSPPALRAWVVGTADIESAVASAPESLGAIEPMSRGVLDWFITIPHDGANALDGVAPAVIQWHTPSHPALAMPHSGLRLARLDLFHPDAKRLSRLLAALELEGPITVSEPARGAAPGLSAIIDTPAGSRSLPGEPYREA